MKRFALLSAFSAGLALTAIPSAAHAATITFTETADLSGSLNGISFTNQIVTLTAVESTTGVSHSGSFYDEYATVTGEIGSGPTFSVTDQVILSVNDATGEIGFGDSLPSPQGSAILFTTASAFDTYKLATAVTGTGNITTSLDQDFGTSAGELEFTGYAQGTKGTFTATLGSPVSVTPEPSSFILLGTGMLGFAGNAVRRLRRQS